ncbi:hypothetical protein NUV66_00465 [Pseudomonas sp. 32.2.56]|uniref:hypothetical protein n=1 Tax=Pseudomonas sp. 32.2.56 TaxID=2969303 RepID=UPI00214FAD7F|nr:hypothetical protein [Pseudomonas sp. 32.2.56]MCR4507759.1 hypothetical protein [Pseudomonas sp. 32.2.56]
MSLLEEGVVRLSWPFEASLLSRLQKKSHSYLASIKKKWMLGIELGTHTATYFDLEGSELKIESLQSILAAAPSLLAEHGVSSTWIDDYRLRVTPPYPIPYVPWHCDNFGKPCEQFKMIVYLSEVVADGGEFCYVPRSNCVSEDYLESYSGSEISRRMGYRRYPGEAGTILLFDTRGVHGVIKNTTKLPRIALIISFGICSE